VERPFAVRVEGLDRDGDRHQIEAEGLLARILQHEVDHLDGILFLDRVSPLKRKMLLKRWQKVRPEMRVLFWGTPDFAVPSLRALLGEGHDVVGVVTQPDRPAGRGRALRPSPVKLVAQDEMLPVLQPERARGDDFMTVIRALEPELSVVVAYGQILRARCWTCRSAAPSTCTRRCCRNCAAPRPSTGPSSWVTSAPASPSCAWSSDGCGSDPAPGRGADRPEETASDLWARLSEIGAEALIEALALLEVGELEEIGAGRVARDVRAAPHARQRTRRLARQRRGGRRHIRAMDAMPGAWTQHRGRVEAVPARCRSRTTRTTRSRAPCCT
jgi:methionyl-tRNA formyltransferase